MRLSMLQTGAAITALLGLLSMGAFCLEDLEQPGPPDPSFACVDGAPPAAGAATLFFSDPGGGASPLAADAVLDLEYGLQGGQHVTVRIRQHTGHAGVWAYRVAFEPATPDPEAPPGAPVLEGENTVAVNPCSSGWTETIAPLFIDVIDGGQPDETGRSPDARGALRVVATHRGSGEVVSAESAVQIAIGR